MMPSIGAISLLSYNLYITSQSFYKEITVARQHIEYTSCDALDNKTMIEESQKYSSQCSAFIRKLVVEEVVVQSFLKNALATNTIDHILGRGSRINVC